jgi:ATP-dependent Clp protease ATP-binding subunit ClpA
MYNPLQKSLFFKKIDHSRPSAYTTKNRYTPIKKTGIIAPKPCNPMFELIQRSKREANQLHHSFVGTEHLLLVLIDSPREAGAALKAAGVTRKQYLQAMIETFGRGEFKPSEMLLTPRLQQIMTSAQTEADDLNELPNENYLLFALLINETANANKLLKSIGVNPHDVLSYLHRWLKNC